MRLINAEELLKILQEQQKLGNVNDSRGRAKAILEVIHAPTIEAEPVKHGRWIDKPYERWKAYDVRYCSKCNWSIHKNHLRKTDLNWNFCPNCGARMVTPERSKAHGKNDSL